MLRLSFLPIYSLRGARAKVAFTHDLGMAALSFLVALYLRVGDNFEYFEVGFVVQATVIYLVIAGVAFGPFSYTAASGGTHRSKICWQS